MSNAEPLRSAPPARPFRRRNRCLTYRLSHRSELSRLRNSASADAYVSFDKLRSIGLKVRYDPVYDEVRIAG